MNCSKKFMAVKYSEGIDRISALPDEILVHILSFLPTKHAVGSSTLARRWHYLFTLIRNFDFDETLMFHPKCGRSERSVRSAYLGHLGLGLKNVKWSNTFNEFVDRVLLLSQPTRITKFRLKSDSAYGCPNVNTWIKYALFHGVTELDINTYRFDSIVLPLSLFVCETLVVLKLHGNFEVKLTESFRLPRLKYLKLHSIGFPDECSRHNLISGCPMLEDLVLGGERKDVVNIYISSLSLRSLTMDFSDESTLHLYRSEVVLDVPNLLYFNYVDYLATNYCINDMNSLKEARIEFLLDGDWTWWPSSDSVLKLMNGVCSANHLYFSGACLEVLTGHHKLPTFSNLSCLELGSCPYVYWRGVLPSFLHNSPILENLVFTEGIMYADNEDNEDNEDKSIWSSQQKSPSCLSSHLKTINIGIFQGLDEEISIIKYILMHGKVLTKLIVYCNMSSQREHRGLEKLLTVERLASGECSIDVRGYQ